MDRPYEPSAGEQRSYYYGLPARPKLVARSSCHEWQPRRRRHAPWNLGKMVFPLEHDHPLVDAWNDPSGPLRSRITQALSRIPWNAIDILRFGWEREHGEDEFERLATLLVSVAPDSTSWAQGCPAVMDCKTILEEHGFCDIDCEMKESKINDLQSPQAPGLSSDETTEPTAFPGVEFYIDVAHLLDRSECPDSSITTYESSIEGTKSLYLRVRRHTSHHKILALACRHVAAAGGHSGPSTATLNRLIEIQEAEVERAQERLNSPGTLGKDTVETYECKGKQAQAGREILGKLCEASSRSIGHAAFAPELYSWLQTRDDQTATWVRDWELVELPEDQDASSWDGIKNRIYIRLSLSALKPHLTIEAPGMVVELANMGVDLDKEDWNRTLRLRDIIPASELFPYKRKGHAKSTKLVGKSGGTAGITFGWASGAKSIVRRPGNGDSDPTECEELCIVNIRDLTAYQTKNFANLGDSGACVWGLDGRVGGFITSANGVGAKWDVTYATPMETVMEHLKKQGFESMLM